MMLRMAKCILRTQPNAKVVLFAHFHDVLQYLRDNLEEYRPLRLDGRVPSDDRLANIAAFQEASARCRLIVGTPMTGGICVSLHDVTGDFPRYTLMMPDYRVSDLHQATGRTFRNGTTGTATVRFVYGKMEGFDVSEKHQSLETALLDALARKGSVMAEVHVGQDGVVFPHEYKHEHAEECLFLAGFAHEAAPVVPGDVRVGGDSDSDDGGSVGDADEDFGLDLGRRAPGAGAGAGPNAGAAGAGAGAYADGGADVHAVGYAGGDVIEEIDDSDGSDSDSDESLPSL